MINMPRFITNLHHEFGHIKTPHLLPISFLPYKPPKARGLPHHSSATKKEPTHHALGRSHQPNLTHRGVFFFVDWSQQKQNPYNGWVGWVNYFSDYLGILCMVRDLDWWSWGPLACLVKWAIWGGPRPRLWDTAQLSMKGICWIED